MKALYFLLLACVLHVAAFAQNYYVNKVTGSDTNSGTIADPFVTIQHAADLATAGDTVFIAAGAYFEKIATLTHSGTAVAPIVFRPYIGDMVLVDGGGDTTTSGSALWTLKSVDYVTVDSINFVNQIGPFVKGIQILEGCDNITISNCGFGGIHFSDIANDVPVDAGDNASPLIVYGASSSEPITNVTLRYNSIQNCRTGFSESMTLTGNVDTFLVYGNLLYGNDNIGIDAAGHWGVCPDPLLDQARNGRIDYNILFDNESPVSTSGQIYIDGGRDIIVERNYIAYGNVGISIGCENDGKTTDNIIVRNNHVYNNARTGIEINKSDMVTGFGKVVGCKLSGNTLYSNSMLGQYTGDMNIVYAENLTVLNNILYSDNSDNTILNYHANNGAGNSFDYNLYYSLAGANSSTFTYDGTGYGSFAGYQVATGQDVNSKFANPQFVDSSIYDFHLKQTSPAINAGDPSYILGAGEMDVDMEGRVNGIVDCGEDETYFPTSVSPLHATMYAHLYPNPVTDILRIEVPGIKSILMELLISDMAGHIYWNGRKQYNAPSIEIDVHQLLPGSYLLTIFQDNDIQTLKFIKKQ